MSISYNVPYLELFNDILKLDECERILNHSMMVSFNRDRVVRSWLYSAEDYAFVCRASEKPRTACCKFNCSNARRMII